MSGRINVDYNLIISFNLNEDVIDNEYDSDLGTCIGVTISYLVFSYASSSTPYSCERVSRWAEFQTRLGLTD